MDSLLVEMRHIDSVEPCTKMELYGETFDTPVMFAALSHLNKTHPEGMVEAARGVKAANAVMWAGMGEREEMEGIAATGARTIKIIKPYADNDEIIDRMRHAEKCGALAVGIDIDHAFGSKNQRGTVLDLKMSPKTMDEIKLLVNATKLPFIIKGVLSTVDARKCLEAGVRGIVVSHHHGIVDYAVPPLMVLPQIAAVVGKHMPIFVDCEISRGMDAFKAIALGATAVSVGRAAMGPLGAEGAQGVTKLFNEMTNELNWAMAVTCAKTLSHIEPSMIWHK
jgi:isopentenyl diphosphate isomerase/L-lactate dehydrogenase-like FMN-dependent dehydrogenase